MKYLCFNTVKLLAFHLFILGSFWCKSQVYGESIDFFTSKNGLSNNSILSLHQDKEGFLWVGTYNGLCRYDGKEFKHYKTSFAGSNTGWAQTIDVIKEDIEGNIWVGTRGSLVAKLNRQTGKWYQYLFENDIITDISFDAKNNVWVSTTGGTLYQFKQDSFIKKVVFPKTIHQVYPFDENSLIICSYEQLYKYSVKRNTYSIYHREIATNIVDRVTVRNNYAFYFNTNQSITTKSLTTGIVKNLSYYNFNNVKNVQGYTSNHHLLFEASGVIYEMDSSASILSEINLTRLQTGLKGQAFTALLGDRSGLIWVGTNSGLFKIDRKKLAFINYTSNSNIKHNYIRALTSKKIVFG